MSMNKRVFLMKKIITVGSVCLLMFFTLAALKITSEAADNISITKETFPDEIFRKFVMEQCDKNKDLILSSAEIQDVTKILLDVFDNISENGGHYSKIRDYKGIEFFTNLKEFSFSYEKDTKIDLSNNQKLEKFKLTTTSYRKKVKILDLSKNKNLNEIYCEATYIETLKLPKGNNLKVLHVPLCSLKKLDISTNRKLEVLNCEYNMLTNLNVANNPQLKTLNCNNNQLKKLNISKNKQLEILECSNNDLSKLDVSRNKKLSKIDCAINKIKVLNISDCKNLRKVNCAYNKLTALETSKNKKLKELRVNENYIKTLELEKNTRLEYLDCKNNKLTKINLYYNPATLEYYFDKKVKNLIPPKGEFQTNFADIIRIQKNGRQSLNVKIEKTKYAAGYQIKYATNKKFRNAKNVYTSKRSQTIHNLTKGKMYYIKVRAYIINPKGKKVFSRSSDIEKVRL